MRQLLRAVMRLQMCEHPVRVAIGTFGSPGVYVCAGCGVQWQMTEWRRRCGAA